MFISVDLPAPFSPTRPTVRPAPTRKLTSFSTGTPKKLLWMFLNSSIGLASGEFVPRGIKHRGKQDHPAFYHHDGEVREVLQVQRVVDEREKEHAEHGREHLAFCLLYTSPSPRDSGA